MSVSQQQTRYNRHKLILKYRNMTLEKFSKNLSDFVDELNLTFPENPIPNDAYSVITEEHMNTFLLELKPYIYSISQYKSDVFL